jgi:cytosine/adenosine deaminase-related metal-dependent hydrolase
MGVTTRIRGRFVIGFEGDDHVVYEHGEVVYEGDRIVFAGHGYDGPVDAEWDAGDAIVSPGFIDLDALGDIDHGIWDTWLTPDQALGIRWSEDYFRNRRHAVFSDEDEAFKRRYALVQLLLNGITTAMPIAAETYQAWAETPHEMRSMAESAIELGMRVYLGPSYRSGVNVTLSDGTQDVLFDEAEGDRGFEEAVAFVREMDALGHDLVRGALLPARIETLTLDLVKRSKAASDELDCPVRLHAAQGALEVELLQRWHGKRPVPLLDELGFFGPRSMIVHAKFLGDPAEPGSREAELGILRDSGTSIVYCPLTNMKYGTPLESFDRYRAEGVNIALGTDTFPPDMIRAMDYANHLGKITDGDRSAASVADLFRAMTLGGARALGRDDLGRLAPGAKADITIVSLGDLAAGTIDDPLRTMCMNLTGTAVDSVVIDGRTVMKHREIPGVDVAAMRERAQAYFDRYRDAYSEWDWRRRPAGELFPPSLRTVPRPR